MHNANCPDVSVVMSVYNGEDYLAEAIESVLGQTFGDLELVLVDDGSSDASGDIGRTYAEKDPRVRLFRHDNRGLAASLNRGLAEARGGLIARMDADDIAPLDRLQAQVDFLGAHPEVGIVGGIARHVDADGVPTGREWVVPTQPGAVAWRLLFRSALPHPGVTMRASVVNGLGGYDAGIRAGQDYDLWTRALFATRLANLDRVVLLRRQTEGQITQRKRGEQRANALAAMRRLHTRLLGADRVEDDVLLGRLRTWMQSKGRTTLAPQDADRAFRYVSALWVALRRAASDGTLAIGRADLADARAPAQSMLASIASEVQSPVQVSLLRARLAAEAPALFTRWVASSAWRRLASARRALGAAEGAG